MNFAKSLIAGFAGAVAVNILHETVRKFDDEAPRLDLIGKQVVKKSAEAMDITPPSGTSLYGIALSGDLLSNATYYAAIGVGARKYMMLRAIGAGLSAGMAAIKAPKPLGLDEKHVTSSGKREAMTVAYYVFGALVTAGVMSFISKKSI